MLKKLKSLALAGLLALSLSMPSLAATELIYPLRDGSGNTDITNDYSSTAGRFTFSGDVGSYYYITAIRFVLTDDAIFEGNFLNLSALTNGLKLGVEGYGSSGAFSPSRGVFQAATDFTAIKTMLDFEAISDVRELKTHDLQSVVYRTAVYEIHLSTPILINCRTTAERQQFTLYISDNLSALNNGRVIIKALRENSPRDWRYSW